MHLVAILSISFHLLFVRAIFYDCEMTFSNEFCSTEDAAPGNKKTHTDSVPSYCTALETVALSVYLWKDCSPTVYIFDDAVCGNEVPPSYIHNMATYEPAVGTGSIAVNSIGCHNLTYGDTGSRATLGMSYVVLD